MTLRFAGASALLLLSSTLGAALPLRWNMGASQPWVDPDGITWEPDSVPSGTAIGECPGPFFWTNLAGLVCRYDRYTIVTQCTHNADLI